MQRSAEFISNHRNYVDLWVADNLWSSDLRVGDLGVDELWV
jgi:hypothetical protein